MAIQIRITTKRSNEQELDYKPQDSAPVSFLDSERIRIFNPNNHIFPPSTFTFLSFFFFCCIVIYPFNKCKHYKLLASFTCSLSIEAATQSVGTQCARRRHAGGAFGAAPSAAVGVVCAATPSVIQERVTEFQPQTANTCINTCSWA